jgi:hypothetical protein
MSTNASMSLAIAHGVTDRTIATWYPFLPRTPRVLVPIHLEVLMVRQPGGVWAECAMKLPAQDPGKVVDVRDLMPKPFSELAQTRPRGAYLHWALPDALTAGTHQDQKTTFPAIPDRWLVLRIFPSPQHSNYRSIRGWVLQAGDADPVVTDLDKWVEPGKPPDGVKKPITALGHGDMAWSAYFDNVVNRLGFYDNLADVPTGPIAYLVCGWYSDPALDPLGDTNIRSLADFDAKMHQLQWSLPDDQLHEAVRKSIHYSAAVRKAGLAIGLSPQAQARSSLAFDTRAFIKPEPGSVPDGPPYVTDGAWWPQNTLYHGSVLGIGWPGLGWPGNEKGLLSGEEGGPPQADKVKVAFGETLAEALATLVTNATGSVQQGRILEAFQQGILPELDAADGQARLDAALHLSAFGSLPGGQVTERVWQPPSGKPPIEPGLGGAPAPGVFERYQSTSNLRAGSKALGSQLKSKPLQKAASGPLDAVAFQAKSFAEETQINAGGLGAMLEMIAPALQNPYVPGEWVDMQLSLPRFFHPTDPAILLQGVNRSFQYGSDGKHAADGTLQCRLTGTCLHQYSEIHGDIVMPPIHPEDILDRGVENGSVPPECDELLGETAILDPGASVHIVETATKGLQVTAQQKAAAVQRTMVSQTAWYAMRDPRIDASPVAAHMSFAGVLPAPVSVGLPDHPWSPVHLEWGVEFIPSTGGISDWSLGETDYDESVPKLPPSPPAGALHFEGRSSLHDGAARQAASAVRKAIEQIQSAAGVTQLPARGAEKHASSLSEMLLLTVANMQFAAGDLPDADRAALEDIATTLESMDVLSSSLSTLHLQLRGGYPGDGTTGLNGNPKPAPFFPLRQGFLHIKRLRLVDSFGQLIDLAGSSAAGDADPKSLLRSEPLNITGRPELLALPPRFTSPARIWLRFMDSEGSGKEARLETDKDPLVNPVCGYLMPNHLDAALEFFGQDGSNLGVLRPADDGSILWEDAPGRPSTVGQTVSRAVPNQYLGGIGDAILRWGVADAGLPSRETALQSLLRVIDSTLWTVDPFGHQGDEHLSLLVGHPIIVARAVLRLEVNEPIDPDAVKLFQIPARIGALTHWQDGVLGYFVNDDYTRLYCSDAAAAGLAREVGPQVGFLQQVNLVQDYYDKFGADTSASPVKHPYIDTSGTLLLHAGDDVHLTLLLEPHTLVHATLGMLPRKEVGLRREWIALALAKIAPTFRFGPVLIDPDHIRMPIAAELNGSWSWDYRLSITEWASGPVTHATQDALLGADPPVGSEGWLRLNPPEEKPKS